MKTIRRLGLVLAVALALPASASAATVRAVMQKVESITPVDASNSTWRVSWLYFSLDGTRACNTERSITVANTDTAAQILVKIIDAIVVYATTQNDSLARTDTYIINYVRGS